MGVDRDILLKLERIQEQLNRLQRELDTVRTHINNKGDKSVLSDYMRIVELAWLEILDLNKCEVCTKRFCVCRGY